MTLENHGVIKVAPGIAQYASIPMPRLRSDYILIKTIAVALNPADWQNLDEEFKSGTSRSLLGHDAAGIVLEVGKDVKKVFKKGDRVAGFAHGGNDLEAEDGTFAEYVVLKGDIAFHIPENITFEQAATFPCGVATIGLGYYSGEPYILIYGGSTASGTLAIQFAKLSGLTVITTSSPRNFPLLKSLGADHSFDYHDPTTPSQIRNLTTNSLHHAFDTIATLSSASICASSLSTLTTPQSTYVNLMDISQARTDIKNIFVLAYTARGEKFEYEGKVWDADLGDLELAGKVFGVLERLLGDGEVRSHPVGFKEGGLRGVVEGLGELKAGRVSGVKLVYRVGEVD